MASRNNYPSICESVKDLIQLIDYEDEIECSEYQPIQYKIDRKDNNKAKDFRRRANQSFSAGDYLQAIVFYTESIKLTEENTESMFESYMKRANTLLKTNHYRECLQDLQRAEDNNCPRSLIDRERLIELKQEANLRVAEQSDPPDASPEIKEKHEWIDCAANCLDLTENNSRHVIAARDIAPGELIALERPAAVYVHPGSVLYCHHCFIRCLNPIPCSTCTLAQYCGDACKHVAWEKYHQYECPIMLTMECHNESIGLPIKIALSMRDFNEEPSEKVECYDPFREIINLQVDASKYDHDSILHIVWLSGQIFHHVKRHTIFFENVKAPLKIFRASLIKLLFIKGMYFHSLRRKIEYDDEKEDSDCVWDIAVPFQSHFMTSCIPNVSITINDHLITRTLFPIKKGEPIIWDSNCLFVATTKQERSEMLGFRGITCSCIACENDWPMLSGAQISNSALHKGIVKLNTLVRKNADNLTMLELIFRKLTDVTMASNEWVKPSKEWQLYIMTMCLCYNDLDRKLTAVQYFRFNEGLDFGVQKLGHRF